ncbi:MAG: anthranilate phosphoribosyltransferase [Proteobacteria bacterium]|nr:anthranilate phosphoribosyltransferase [Pseudomonadota bacterium]
MIIDALKKLADHLHLTEDEMTAAMNEIMEGACTDAQIACFLTALRLKGETADEITAAARVMRQKALSVPVKNRAGLVDIVGTGGDGAHTFNISTAAAFVACGAGLRVAKHGNRSVSSRSGSADVMEKLGVIIDLTPESVGRCIDEIGMGFLFAPKFHLAMKYATPVRREIGIRTLFNMLGPLTNPADADIQLIGVYDERLCAVFAGVLERLGRKRALIVHGMDGLDELSLSAETEVYDLSPSGIVSYRVRPEDAGLARAAFDSVRGGDAAENAAIIVDIFKGKPGPCRDMVLLNAGAALMAGGRAATLREGAAIAADVIDSGRALRKLAELKEFSRTLE